jgi:hypothetical protein
MTPQHKRTIADFYFGIPLQTEASNYQHTEYHTNFRLSLFS